MKSISLLPQELQGYLKLSDAVIITDSQHMIIDVNEQYESITGYNRETIIGLQAGFLKSNLTPETTYRSLKEALSKNEPWSGVFINRKKTKEIWHSSITITPFQTNNETLFVGVFRELEQLKQGLYLSENKKAEVERELLKMLAISCEIRDPDTESHLHRVQKLTKQLLIIYNERSNQQLSLRFIENVFHSSILHDIGKAGIPETILYKPGPLTSYERKIIEMHPLIGVDTLNKTFNSINSPVILKHKDVARNIILHHHEKWDGTGYPHKLQGEQIPLEARIVAVVDVFDALTSRRPYKEAWEQEKALSFIHEQKGIHFDPNISEAFLSLF